MPAAEAPSPLSALLLTDWSIPCTPFGHFSGSAFRPRKISLAGRVRQMWRGALNSHRVGPCTHAANSRDFTAKGEVYHMHARLLAASTSAGRKASRYLVGLEYAIQPLDAGLGAG